LFQAGRIREAYEACDRVIRDNPDFAEAWHLFGLLSFQLGDMEAATERIREATQLKPGYAAAYNDLGNVLSELLHYSDAETAYRRAIRHCPGNGKLHSNLGSVLRQQGRPEEAVTHCEKALDLDPYDVNAHYNLACAYRDCDRLEEAAESYRSVLAADPEHSDVYRQLCGVLRRAGRYDEACEACEKWLKHDPDNPVAQHILSGLSGDSTPSRASDAYIQRVFDEFAARFDSDLQQLGYQGPKVLAATLAARFGEPRSELYILDAGCGTGLCAGVLRPYAKSLVGVDLSQEMLARAEKQQVYDELIAAELTGFLSSNHQQFDLIVAFDTFNYFGDLGLVLESAVDALRPSGSLVFTVEISRGEFAPSFQLDVTGRYCHTRLYLETTLKTSRFAVDSISTVELRCEAGQPVKAMLVQARPLRFHVR
jgi:predicted TPR repeat methyltransferase